MLLLLLEDQDLLLELLLLLWCQFDLATAIHLDNVGDLLEVHMLRQLDRRWELTRNLHRLEHLLISAKRLVKLVLALSSTNLRWTRHLPLEVSELVVHHLLWHLRHVRAIHNMVMFLLDEVVLLLLLLLELPSILLISLLDKLLNEMH